MGASGFLSAGGFLGCMGCFLLSQLGSPRHRSWDKDSNALVPVGGGDLGAISEGETGKGRQSVQCVIKALNMQATGTQERALTACLRDTAEGQESRGAPWYPGASHTSGLPPGAEEDRRPSMCAPKR